MVSRCGNDKSGTPTVSGVFNYTVTTTGGCPPATATGTKTVTPLNTIATVLIKRFVSIVLLRMISLATTELLAQHLLDYQLGYRYMVSRCGNDKELQQFQVCSITVTTTGGCPPATATGTITVTPLNTIASGTNQTVCINSAITNISLATTGLLVQHLLDYQQELQVHGQQMW